MANYIKTTDFAVKDGLVTGDPDKRVRGTEIDAEFSAISTAISTKQDADISPVPAGSVIYVAQNTAPGGFLRANGAAVSRATYSTLFAAIGSTFGDGDGIITFNIPDMRGEFPRGWDDGRGVDSGRAFGSTQLDQMQKITGSAGGNIWNLNRNNLTGAGVFTGSTQTNVGAGGGDNAHSIVTLNFDSVNSPNARVSSTTDGETRARNVALLACIKF